MRFFEIAGGPIQVFRGENSGNKGGNFWTRDREFARNFTQTGRDQEIRTRYIDPSHIMDRSGDVYAGDEAAMDAALAQAKAAGFKAICVGEGEGEPPSIFVFDKTALRFSSAA